MTTASNVRFRSVHARHLPEQVAVALDGLERCLGSPQLGLRLRNQNCCLLAQDISLPDLGKGGFHLRVLVLGEQFQDSGAAERI